MSVVSGLAKNCAPAEDEREMKEGEGGQEAQAGFSTISAHRDVKPRGPARISPIPIRLWNSSHIRTPTIAAAPAIGWRAAVSGNGPHLFEGAFSFANALKYYEICRALPGSN